MTRLVIVGNPDEIHIGAHFRDAANALGIANEMCDTRAAFDAGWLARQWHWRARGHRPARLDFFQRHVLEMCAQFAPTHLLATGLAPLTRTTLLVLKQRGVRTLNFLTDDPWSATQRAEWFLRAVSLYDSVFTPRRANVSDLLAAGCARVEFLPFAYNPRVHFPSTAAPDAARACDVLFAGGADADRVPYIALLLHAGMKVHLYGGYWERYAATRAAARGHVDLPTLRDAIQNARVCLNLVRRSNRDDNVMRSFEVPAMRGCMLTEDTPTHRAVFGAEGQAVLYFSDAAELVKKARGLLEDVAERARLADAAHACISKNKHTYQDRLAVMLEWD